MARFISTPNGFVPAEEYRRPVRKRSTAVPIPNIVTDQLDNVVNPIDGKAYDSKSAYYKAVADAGCHIAESKPDLEKRDVPHIGGVKEDIANAYSELEAKG